MGILKPKHTVAQRSMLGYQGEIHHLGVFVRSGSIENVTGNTTGSLAMSFDAIALRLRRVEVFHSGAATEFNVRVENATPNTGSFHDQRNIVVCYRDVPGWKHGGTDSEPGIYNAGIDQVEDLLCVTDTTEGRVGNLYLKVMPFGTGDNNFKYLMFFEAVFLYQNKDGSING